MATETTYYITNSKDRPINVIWDGSGPTIQVLRSCCECYSSRQEAVDRLNFLRERTGKPLRHLKVSTYKVF